MQFHRLERKAELIPARWKEEAAWPWIENSRLAFDVFVAPRNSETFAPHLEELDWLPFLETKESAHLSEMCRITKD